MHRMRATIVFEYMADPANYPPGLTPQQMAELDTCGDFATIVAEQGTLTVTALDAQTS
ncbi:hypothetical protein LDO11_08675 [Luteimonas sp. MHLX1A]|nr:hypothetical protein [Luteimonas sp. MHLX1A]